MDKFSFTALQKLNYEEQKKYITKFFVPLTNGSHCFLNNGTYELVPDDVIKKVYFKRVDDKLQKFYFKEYTGIKSPVYEIDKPVFFDDNINLCPQLPKHKPYKDFEQSIKDKAQIFLDYINEILCNKQKVNYEYLLKWLSNLCKGNKNDCAIVLKTTLKGVGKSTLPTMIINHIIGEKLSLEIGSEPLKSKFNSALGGKLFVSFEELETFSQQEWMVVDCVLKRQITSKKIQLQKKGQDSFEANNINNYMLLSNHDVADADRRYYVIDVQTHRLGDRKYWSNIYDNCFNNEVGSCLYSFFREIDTTNFHPQDYPITRNKLNSITKRLDTVYLYLKSEYVLKGKDINCRLVDLYVNYCDFCQTLGKKSCPKTDFTTKLSELQINYIKSCGYIKYKASLDDLKEIAKKHKWINDLDEYENNADADEEKEINPLDNGIMEPKINNEKVNNKEFENLQLQNDKLTSENCRLLKEIEKLQKLTKKLKLADGEVYNYDSDDDEKMSSNELEELLNLTLQPVEAPKELETPTKKKKIIKTTKISIEK
jgi:hypothetical protein